MLKITALLDSPATILAVVAITTSLAKFLLGKVNEATYTRRSARDSEQQDCTCGRRSDSECSCVDKLPKQ